MIKPHQYIHLANMIGNIKFSAWFGYWNYVGPGINEGSIYSTRFK